MNSQNNADEERLPSPAAVKRVTLTFLVGIIFGAIIVFCGVTSRSLQLRHNQAAGIKSDGLPFGPPLPSTVKP